MNSTVRTYPALKAHKEQRTSKITTCLVFQAEKICQKGWFQISRCGFRVVDPLDVLWKGEGEKKKKVVF